MLGHFCLLLPCLGPVPTLAQRKFSRLHVSCVEMWLKSIKKATIDMHDMQPLLNYFGQITFPVDKTVI